jgi:acetyltransferase-like isoleucine patch superfamily enzyme
MKNISINNQKQCLVDVKLGNDVQIFNFVNAYGCSIGNGTRIGAFVEIQKGASIGKNCKISSHSFICEGVNIADNVFVGHSVTFINDKFPRSTTDQGLLKEEEDWDCAQTIVEEGASIGSGVTILCGITIGKKSIIGAGSVVVHDVQENTIVAGNPARFIRTIE